MRPKASWAGLICRTDQCFQHQRLPYTCGMKTVKSWRCAHVEQSGRRNFRIASLTWIYGVLNAEMFSEYERVKEKDDDITPATLSFRLLSATRCNRLSKCKKKFSSASGWLRPGLHFVAEPNSHQNYHLLCPRPEGRGIKRWCASDVCRLSVAYIGPKSRTERSRKTKIGTEVAHVTRDSDTTLKVKRSKVNLQGAGHIATASPHSC